MAEVIGIVSGVIGLVDSTANHIDEFARRCHAFIDSPDKIDNTSRDCECIRETLQKLDEDLREKRIKVKDDLQADFLAHTASIEQGFKKAKALAEQLKLRFPSENPSSLSIRLERVKLKIGQLFCKNTYAARIDALAKDVSDAKTTVSRLSCCVQVSRQLREVTENVGEVDGGGLSIANDDPSNVAEDLSNFGTGVTRLRSDFSNMAAGVAAIRQTRQAGTIGLSDSFRAKFEVPLLPSDVLLDFDVCEQEEEPLTIEGVLKSHLMTMARTSDGPGTVATALAAQGMGGVGKTSALIGLGQDSDVREAFKEGGIYFISIGRDARSEHVIKELARVVHASGGCKASKDISDAASLRAAVEITVTFFAELRTLFLCDDIWETDDSGIGYLRELKQLLATHQRSGLVISTRSRRIASADGIIPVTFKPLRPEGDRSLGIFLSCSRAKVSKQDVDQSPEECRQAVSQVLSRCVGVPLTLAVAGRAVLMITQYEDCPWHQAMVKYAQDLESSISSVITEEIDAYPNFIATVSASLQIADQWAEKLELQMQKGQVLRCSQLFTAMAVLRPQIQVSCAMLRKLWGIPEGNLAHEIVGLLADLNLVTMRGGTGTEYVVGLHDLILEYCQLQAGNRLGKYHCDLLDEYFRYDADVMTLERVTGADYIHLQPGNGDVSLRTWWMVTNDGYIQENICWHLAMGECVSELVALLSHERWTEFRTKYGGLSAWESDFKHAFHSLEKMSSPGSSKYSTKTVLAGLRLVRDAVKDAWVFITKNPRELAFQMHARLCDTSSEIWTVTSYLESTRGIASKPFLKPMRRYWPLPGRASGTDIFQEGPVSSISLTNDMVFATVAVGCELLVCKMDTRSILQRLQGHKCDVRSVAMSQDAERIVSVSDDGTLLLWNRESTATFSEPTHLSKEGQFTCVTMTKDGSLLLAGSRDGSVKLWDAGNGSVVKELRKHDGPVTAVAVSKDGKHIASCSEDGSVRLWDGVSGNQRCPPLCDNGSHVSCVAMSADGSRVVSGSYDDTIQLWDGENGTLLCEPLLGHAARVQCVAMTSDGTRFVSGADDNTLRVWDARSGQAVALLRKHEGRISAVAISADGRSIVSGSRDHSIRLWDLEKEATTNEPRKGHCDSVLCVTVSADGSRIASGSKDKTVRLWSSENGEAVCGPLRGHDAPVVCVAFCTNGSRVVSGSDDRTVRMWDWESRREIGEPLCGHKDRVTCVTASDDGKYVVSGSRDGTLRLWDLESTDVTNVLLHGHKKWVSCLAISPDGSTFVSGSRDRTIRLWQVSSLRTVGSPVTFNACSVWMRDGFVFARQSSFSKDQLGTRCWQVDEEQGLVCCDAGSSSSIAANGDTEEEELVGVSAMSSPSEGNRIRDRTTSDNDVVSIPPVSLGINLAEQYSFISCFQKFVVGGRTTSDDGCVLSTLPASLGVSIVERDAWFFHPTERSGTGGIVVLGLRNGAVCILELIAR